MTPVSLLQSPKQKRNPKKEGDRPPNTYSRNKIRLSSHVLSLCFLRLRRGYMRTETNDLPTFLAFFTVCFVRFWCSCQENKKKKK